MTRLEMLKWMYENCKDESTSCYYKFIEDTIGTEYYSELERMGFVMCDFKLGGSYVCLSDLGKAYCDELFN